VLRYTHTACLEQSSLTLFLLGLNIFNSALSPSVAIPHTAFLTLILNRTIFTACLPAVICSHNVLRQFFFSPRILHCCDAFYMFTHLTCSLITLLVTEKVHL